MVPDRVLTDNLSCRLTCEARWSTRRDNPVPKLTVQRKRAVHPKLRIKRSMWRFDVVGAGVGCHAIADECGVSAGA